MNVRTVRRRPTMPEENLPEPLPAIPARPAEQSLKVVFFVSEDWWFCLHWLNLALRLKERGHEITIICNVGSDRERIELAGFKVVPLRLDRSGRVALWVGDGTRAHFANLTITPQSRGGG